MIIYAKQGDQIITGTLYIGPDGTHYLESSEQQPELNELDTLLQSEGMLSDKILYPLASLELHGYEIEQIFDTIEE